MKPTHPRLRIILGQISPPEVGQRIENLIRRQPDMELVGRIAEPTALLLAVGETDADVVIMCVVEGGAEPGICSHLLMEYSELILLVLSVNNNHGLLLRRVPSREEVSDTSDENILMTIREASAVRNLGF